jgi:hypothetical protein
MLRLRAVPKKQKNKRHAKVKFGVPRAFPAVLKAHPERRGAENVLTASASRFISEPLAILSHIFSKSRIIRIEKALIGKRIL